MVHIFNFSAKKKLAEFIFCFHCLLTNFCPAVHFQLILKITQPRFLCWRSTGYGLQATSPSHFCTTHELIMALRFLSGYKNKRRIFVTRKLHETLLSVFTSEILLENSHTPSFICCLWLLSKHVMAKLNRCDGDFVAQRTVYTYFPVL